MKKIILSLSTFFLLATLSFSQAQTQRERIPRDIEKTVDESLESVRNILKNIEIPEIDIEEITREIERAIPTQKEMDSILQSVEESIKIVEDLDLSFIDDIMRDVEGILSDLEITLENRNDRNDTPSEKKNKPKKDF